jgi:hypothetical protein
MLEALSLESGMQLFVDSLAMQSFVLQPECLSKWARWYGGKQDGTGRSKYPPARESNPDLPRDRRGGGTLNLLIFHGHLMCRGQIMNRVSQSEGDRVCVL